MLKKHHQFFASILSFADLCCAVLSWQAAYFLRFRFPPLIDLFGRLEFKTLPTPPTEHYKILPLVLAATYFSYKTCGLYRPRRMRWLIGETVDLFKASTLSFVLVLSISFFLFHADYSRTLFLIYFVLSSASTLGGHLLLRGILRRLREKGYNLRRVLVIGAGTTGTEVARRLRANAWMGLQCIGYLDDDPARTEEEGCPVLGPLSALHEQIARHQADQVICALPFEEHAKLPELFARLSRETVDVRMIPDQLSFSTLRASVSDLDGLPVLNLQESPLWGWNRVLKRLMDVVCSAVGLVVLSPVLGIIALVIKCTSRGPILYRQERMGLDGRIFQMLKFRTMRADAEAKTGAVWARPDDPRRTGLGSFLRRFSLDELPQLWNVLAGEMSLVGPRPERPVFIQKFRETVPLYMARHKMKAGITGWAQINGWRGNTSLEKRIEYDLYYIEHWSIWFDLQILIITPFKSLMGKNAY
jgi:Undecaprenyl-phosphate glucose phosphotransferase